jgi:hypothetical protein
MKFSIAYKDLDDPSQGAIANVSWAMLLFVDSIPHDEQWNKRREGRNHLAITATTDLHTSIGAGANVDQA